jgi:hypothetical protein
MSEVFPITPASASIYWVIGPVGVLLLGLLMMFAYISYSATHVRFEVSPEGLRIRGDLYGRFVPSASLLPAEARQIDLRSDTQHRPARRTNGAGLPGYRAGWFRLADREKALLFVTDTSRVVYVPTRDGYSLLLSPADPQGFLASLRNTLRR